MVLSGLLLPSSLNADEHQESEDWAMFVKCPRKCHLCDSAVFTYSPEQDPNRAKQTVSSLSVKAP